MRKHTLQIASLAFFALLFVGPVHAQVSSADILFARLATSTARMAYQQSGKEMKEVGPLLDEAVKLTATDRVKSYRSFMKAAVLMSGTKWTPDSELATALDFTLNAKIVDIGERLEAQVSFLFDVPNAVGAPYHLDLDLLKRDLTHEASITNGINVGEVKTRRAGETLGFSFDPSKLVGPGLHLIRATLKDGQGTALTQYYRSFFVITDLGKRLSSLEKTIELLPNDDTVSATSARYLLESIKLARTKYLGGNYQNLTGYLHTTYRLRGFALSEFMDFDTAMEQASKLGEEVKAGRNPLASAKGDLKLAYQSTFDGQLVPYRLYVPSKYDKSTAFPMITLLHGAGGDENSFFGGYQGLWPKLAEERGYIIVAVNGRGPLSGYAKANGAEQDVLDVTALVQKNYSIDPARVYLAGHSMGASGTWSIGLGYRDRFAALAPIAGTRMSPQIETALNSGRKIPLIIVSGAKDALVPVAGCRQVAEKAKGLGYEVKYLEYPDGDHMSVVASSVKDVYDWFDAHRRPIPKP